MKVLVAEDENFSRTILTSMIERWGYEPIVVENGEQALEVLQQEDAPNLILLDWYMPGMSGLEVLQKEKKKKNLKLPYIILLTANAEKEDVLQGINAGANDYVLKPYDRDDLKTRIDRGKHIVELQLSSKQESSPEE